MLIDLIRGKLEISDQNLDYITDNFNDANIFAQAIYAHLLRKDDVLDKLIDNRLEVYRKEYEELNTLQKEYNQNNDGKYDENILDFSIGLINLIDDLMYMQGRVYQRYYVIRGPLFPYSKWSPSSKQEKAEMKNQKERVRKELSKKKSSLEQDS